MMHNDNIVRVLIYAPLPPPFSGPEISTELLLKNIQQKSIKVKFLKSNIKTENWKRGKFDFKGLFKFAFIYIKFIITLLKFRPNKVYLLLSSSKIGFLRDSILIYTANILRKKVIAHYRGGNFNNYFDKQSNRFKLYIKYILRKIDCIIVQAEILKEMFKGIYSNELRVLYNGVNIEKRYSPKTFNGKIILLFIGHIAYSKGFYHLIKAYKNIFQKYEIQLNYAGTLMFSGNQKNTQREFLSGKNLEFYNSHEDEIENEITEFVSNSGKYNAHYLGIIDEVEKEKVYSDASILILTSITEGFSMTVLEAMQRGLPVIVTKVGALPEIVIDNINGFLIDNCDSKQIEEAILNAVSDLNHLEEISRNNIKYVCDSFDTKKMAKDFEELLFNA